MSYDNQLEQLEPVIHFNSQHFIDDLDIFPVSSSSSSFRTVDPYSSRECNISEPNTSFSHWRQQASNQRRQCELFSHFKNWSIITGLKILTNPVNGVRQKEKSMCFAQRLQNLCPISKMPPGDSLSKDSCPSSSTGCKRRPVDLIK